MFHFAETLQSSDSKHKIGRNERPYLIAELGLNHNKDPELAKKMVAAAAESGANAVKLQSYTTKFFVNSDDEQAKPLYDIFAEYEIDQAFHIAVRDAAKSEGVDFISTPLTLDWVDHLAEMNADYLKIASGDINNFQLLERAASTKLPLLISTGASHFSQIERVISFLKLWKREQSALLHCVSLYPTPPEKTNLSRIARIENHFQVLTGFSDHTLGDSAAPLAIAAGAVLIEKHFTLDTSLPGPDHKISATPDILKSIREKADLAFAMRQGNDDSWEEEFAGDTFGKRSLYQTASGLLAMRPRRGTHPGDFDFLAERLKEQKS